MKENESGAGIIPVTESKYETPENFFPVIVDNFFNEPEALVDYGKSLPKTVNRYADGQLLYPGLRSKNLWEIDEILFQTIMTKILSCYFDLGYIEISWENSNMTFQEIPQYSENKNDIKNRGWIHQDFPGNHQLAGLIYLTPNIEPDSGTSLFDLKSSTVKLESHNMKFPLWEKESPQSHIKYEENFLEKVRVQNRFNRLIMYDTREWHRANSYYSGDGEDTRLTLAFFVGGINVQPLKRIKDGKLDTTIKLQIESRLDKFQL